MLVYNPSQGCLTHNPFIITAHLSFFVATELGVEFTEQWPVHTKPDVIYSIGRQQNVQLC